MRGLLLFLWILGCNSVFAEWPYDSVCKVSCLRYAGSGTLVGVKDNVGLVLTAAHIFEGDDRRYITCSFPNGFRSRAVILGEDRAYDITALQIEVIPEIATPSSVTAANPDDGPFVRVGYPYYGQGQLFYTVGDFVSYGESGGQSAWAPSMVHTAGQVQSGFSGGALFNRYGEYCGVVSGVTGNSPRGMNRVWGASGPALLQFVNQWMEVRVAE